ncbi:MAG: crossover junction endodeoxyribonuclease RuvC [Abditibacteriota bacterium]|nr:crossover junction endodeoxyribonuclease RuvC [Abditibacteriota bacterium]
MRVLGFDPGTATTGFAVAEKVGGVMKPVTYGTILTTPEKTDRERLVDIYNDLNTVIDTYKPDTVAMEKLFFSKNQTTGIAVAKACGVMQLVCAFRGLEVKEYTPSAVKLSVVGYGNAEKKQVQYMVCKLFNLKETPKPDDAADALALCACRLSDM